MGQDSKTPITISYRDEGRGMGPFWDHHTVQIMSGRQTRVCFPVGLPPTQLTEFLAGIKANSDSMPVMLQTGGHMPEAATSYGKGLLIIPGYTRKTALKRPDVYKKRKAFEQTLLKDAINRGRPVLAVCGGSWRLWSALGGGEFMTTQGHDYPLAHPNDDLRVTSRGEIVGNVMAHNIVVTKKSTLQAAMRVNDDELIPVNSVHWQAPYAEECPKNVTISAKSKAFEPAKPAFFWSLFNTVLSWFGLKLARDFVESDTVEAFETDNGAPMMGVQWHPEAFAFGGSYARCQRELFSFMSDAGETYAKKQDLNAEIKVKRTKNPTFFLGDSTDEALPKEPQNEHYRILVL